MDTDVCYFRKPDGIFESAEAESFEFINSEELYTHIVKLIDEATGGKDTSSLKLTLTYVGIDQRNDQPTYIVKGSNQYQEACLGYVTGHPTGSRHVTVVHKNDEVKSDNLLTKAIGESGCGELLQLVNDVYGNRRNEGLHAYAAALCRLARAGVFAYFNQHCCSNGYGADPDIPECSKPLILLWQSPLRKRTVQNGVIQTQSFANEFIKALKEVRG